jgi:maltose O-acetyltransferase
MGVIRFAIERVLRGMAGLEFDLTKAATPNRLRKSYLRYMRVTHDKHVSIGSNLYIRNRGNLSLGERCGIGSFARIWNYAPIHIGDDFLSAGGLTLNSATHDPTSLEPAGQPIRIGNRVWCGVNVTILAGVTIGDDVVIAAGAVVVSDIASNCVVGGVPAKKLRDLGRDATTKLWDWVDPV